jgi:hypothetical protein
MARTLEILEPKHVLDHRHPGRVIVFREEAGHYWGAGLFLEMLPSGPQCTDECNQ